MPSALGSLSNRNFKMVCKTSKMVCNTFSTWLQATFAHTKKCAIKKINFKKQFPQIPVFLEDPGWLEFPENLGYLAGTSIVSAFTY